LNTQIYSNHFRKYENNNRNIFKLRRKDDNHYWKSYTKPTDESPFDIYVRKIYTNKIKGEAVHGFGYPLFNGLGYSNPMYL